MNEEEALKLTKPSEILTAAKEAEQRNCDNSIINKLYENYYKAVEKEARCQR